MFNGNKRSFNPAPEGPQQLVCVDIVDLGVQPTEYGDKPKVRIVWQTADLDPANGKPYRVSGQYTNSLHEKAGLRRVLESWLGRRLSQDEVENGFDPESMLLGLNALSNLVHSDPNSKGDIYANISSIMPVPRGTKPITAIDYDRVKDRAPKGADAVPF